VTAVIAGPLAAAVIAAVLSLFEVVNARGRFPRVGVLQWVLIRVTVDAIVAALVFPVVLSRLGSTDWWWSSIIAGVSAPIVLRLQCNFATRGGGIRAVGPDNFYKRLREAIDGKIDRYMSSKDSGWVVVVAAPALRTLPVTRLTSEIKGYYELRDGLSDTKRRKELEYFEALSVDIVSGDRVAYESIAFRLLQSGDRELLDGLVRAGGEAAGGDQRSEEAITPANSAKSSGSGPARSAKSAGSAGPVP